jgi:hypothetical protein
MTSECPYTRALESRVSDKKNQVKELSEQLKLEEAILVELQLLLEAVRQDNQNREQL